MSPARPIDHPLAIAKIEAERADALAAKADGGSWHLFTAATDADDAWWKAGCPLYLDGKIGDVAGGG